MVVRHHCISFKCNQICLKSITDLLNCFLPIWTLSTHMNNAKKKQKKNITSHYTTIRKVWKTGMSFYSRVVSEKRAISWWFWLCLLSALSKTGVWSQAKLGYQEAGPMSSKFRHSASSKQNHVLNHYYTLGNVSILTHLCPLSRFL